MNRRHFLQSLALSAAGLGLKKFASANSSRKPNFVVILTDDLGWTGLRCFGSKYYETPNLDRLCAKGMKFTDGYADAPIMASFYRADDYNCSTTQQPVISKFCEIPIP